MDNIIPSSQDKAQAADLVNNYIDHCLLRGSNDNTTLCGAIAHIIAETRKINELVVIAARQLVEGAYQYDGFNPLVVRYDLDKLKEALKNVK